MVIVLIIFRRKGDTPSNALHQVTIILPKSNTITACNKKIVKNKVLHLQSCKINYSIHL